MKRKNYGPVRLAGVRHGQMNLLRKNLYIAQFKISFQRFSAMRKGNYVRTPPSAVNPLSLKWPCVVSRFVLGKWSDETVPQDT
jgi:hypothetical protein